MLGMAPSTWIVWREKGGDHLWWVNKAGDPDRRAPNVLVLKLVPAPCLEKNPPKKQACAQSAGRATAIELKGFVRYTGTRLIRGEIRGGRTFGPGAASNPTRR